MTQMHTIEFVPFTKELVATLTTPGTDPIRIAEDFFDLVDLFEENTHLACTATDPTQSVVDEQGLVSSAFASRMAAAALPIVNTVVADH